MPNMTEKLGRFTAKIMAEASAEAQRSMDQVQQERQVCHVTIHAEYRIAYDDTAEAGSRGANFLL